MPNKISLEEFVTSQTLISRRELMEYVVSKKVCVNEFVVDAMSFLIEPDHDSVKVAGRYIENQYSYLYYRFYKPKGILSTMEDPQKRDCVGDYIRQLKLPIKPVGRLDRQTSGLMILTNDGDLAQWLTHPSYQCLKRYECLLDKSVSKLDLKRLKSGFFLDDGPIKFDKVRELRGSELQVSISEGRNRIVRRSFEHLGYKVKQLKRLTIGPLSLEGLEGGQSKVIRKQDVQALKEAFVVNG